MTAGLLGGSDANVDATRTLEGFDVVSCMFAIHYGVEAPEAAARLARAIGEQVRAYACRVA